MIHTRALFDPTVGGKHSSRYKKQKPLKPIEISNLTSQEIGSGRHGHVYCCRIRNHDFASKFIQTQNQAKKEYDLAAALVEPPAWKHIIKEGQDGNYLSQTDTAEAEEWLHQRKKHPGFQAILHYRYYIPLEVGAVILTDLCQRTLEEYLLEDPEFSLKAEVPNPQHPIGEAVTQVLQGLHYLSFIARVRHNDLHLNNVMRRAPGHWCIIDFGKATHLGNSSPETALYEDFTQKFPSQLLSTIWVSEPHPMWFAKYGERSFMRGGWSNQDPQIIKTQYNSMCPWLGDLLLLRANTFYTRHAQLPQSEKVVHDMVIKAMTGYEAYSTVTPSLPIATSPLPIATPSLPIATSPLPIATPPLPIATSPLPIATPSLPIATPSLLAEQSKAKQTWGLYIAGAVALASALHLIQTR